MAGATIAYVQGPPQHQVFITFRGEVRTGFVSFLQSALLQNGIRTIIDEDMPRGTPLTDLFRAIEESKIALVIFSPKYAESNWCLDELVKIVERKDEGKLVVIPICYKVNASHVKHVKGSFGHAFVKAHGDKGARPGRVAKRTRRRGAKGTRRGAEGNPPFDFPVNSVDHGKMTRPARVDANRIQKWREALLSVSSDFVRELGESKEADFVATIVEDVKKALNREREMPETSSSVKGRALESQEICLSECEVPPWFSHKTDGTILQPQLPPHWWDGKFAWLALCAVVSFRGYQDHTSSLSVKCKCEIKNKECDPIIFTYVVGGWGEPGEESRHMESDHVFVGYASCLSIRNVLEQNKKFDGYTHTMASFKFYVVDGTSEVSRYEVVKCGLNLVNAPDETYNPYWKQNPGVTPGTNHKFQNEARNVGGCPANDAKNPSGTSEENIGNNVPNTACLSFLSCWSLRCCCRAYEYIKSKIISWTERSPTLVEGKPSG